MQTQDQAGIRHLENGEDLDETRLEAIGFVFHGTIPAEGAKRGAVRAGTNLLHFARCAKIERAMDTESKIWFRTVTIAKKHLDGAVGTDRWKWCKVCEREITQRILDEV
jgi:hypothetical protein